VFALALFLGVLGLCLGRFAGVGADRVPRGESPIGGRSRCDSCGAPIAAYDNVPVLSWLMLRGRCRRCGERIPVRYPLVEAGLGATFAAVYLTEDGDLANVVIGCVFASLLAVVTLTDLERRIIPNVVVGFGTVAGIVLVAFLDPSGLVERLLAAVAAGGFLLAVALAYPRGMGMGDVKLAGMMGIYLGAAVAPGLLIGFASGATFGVALIARHGAAARKFQVPFGPFLALGGVVALLAGADIVDWYTDTFFSD
jgi:leader peptidase (prepilin peptidase)/N-methyltransferase